MRVKICGLNTWKETCLVLDAGADALGFLVGITHLAEDKVTNEKAREIIKRLPPFVCKVAVTHLQESKEIIPMLTYLGVDTVQLHNEMNIEEISKIKNELPYLKIIKSVSVRGEQAIDDAKKLENYVDAIILDSRTKDRLGGTGLVHDWNISKKIVSQCNKPVILAGGLKPNNLQEAIDKVKPFAVDVNSGVEVNNMKDKNRVKEFIEIAHRN